MALLGVFFPVIAHISEEVISLCRFEDRNLCCFSFQVGSILNGMLDQSFRERTIRKQQGVKLVTAVLRNWKRLDSWWAKDSSPESKMAVLTLLAKVLQVCIVL